VVRASTPQLPAAPSAAPAAEPDTKTSITGGLRPSVVQTPSSRPDPAKTSALPAAPVQKTADATQIARQGTGSRPSASASASVPPAKAAVPGAKVTRPATGPVPGAGAGTSAFPAGAAAGVSGGAAGAAGAARTQVGEAVRNVRATVAAAASRGPRRARLQLKKIDPWSVMKFSFAVSLVLFIVAVVATALLYTVLDALGVFKSLNDTIGQLTATQDQTGTPGAAAATAQGFTITAKLVIGAAALLGAVNMVLFTALATLGAFIYNVCADLVGGIEVTLAERD
jgi:hypothetical protein